MTDLTKLLTEARAVENRAADAKFIDSPEEVAFTYFAHEHFSMMLDLLERQGKALEKAKGAIDSQHNHWHAEGDPLRSNCGSCINLVEIEAILADKGEG